MGLSVIIGFVLQLFFKLGMEYIWSVLNMLQLISHTRHLDISIPAQVVMNLDKILALCNFQIHKIDFIQDFLRENFLPLFEIL